MAMKTLNTLVQRGVTVLVKSGRTVETRRGLGYHGVAEPLAPISMRSPWSGNPIQNPDQRQYQEQDQLDDTAAKRAGRLDCQAGNPQRRSSSRRWPSFLPASASASLRGLDIRRLRLAITAG